MLTIACVLRSGGEYKPEHVVALRDGVRRHLSLPHRFVCLSDKPIVDVHCILLEHGWPGWWSKVELWRPGVLSGAVVYLDLDTLVVGSIDDMVLGHRFTVLRNVWAPAGSPRIGSGLMAWSGDHSAIYHRFAADPARWMATPQTKDNWGDQGFLQGCLATDAERWQERHPGRVVSWRADCQAGVPLGASIIVFGGPARPWKTELWGRA